MRIGFALLCAIGVALMSGLFLKFLDPAVELLFRPQGKAALSLPQLIRAHPLVAVPVIIIALSIGRFLCQRGLVTTINYVGHTLTGKLQADLFDNLIHADLKRLDQTHSGQYVSSVLYDAGLMREAVTNGMINSVQQGLILSSALIVMFLTDPVLSLGVIAIAPLIGFVMSHYLKKTKIAAQGAMSETSNLTKALLESLKGVRTIKMDTREDFECARIGSSIEKRQKHIIKGANARAVAAPSTEALTGFLTALIITYVGWRASDNSMGMGAFLTFLAALMQAGQSIRQIASLQATLTEGRAASVRVFEALDIAPQISEPVFPKPFPEKIENITFQNVSFGYDPSSQVLKNINLSIRAGTSLAIVGPSGAGKSSFLNLLGRFYDPVIGEILINETPLRQVSLKQLRAHMAYVGQEPFMFDDSLLANLIYARPQASQDEIWQALKDAAIDDFVTSHPLGLEMPVGEAGVLLSGGQKQRLAIARAILKNAPIILLDEATSALDTQSEQKVQTAINRLMVGRTVIMIAHRLASIKHCDDIIVLKSGEIIEQGTHQSLIDHKGLYCDMVAAQYVGGAG